MSDLEILIQQVLDAAEEERHYAEHQKQLKQAKPQPERSVRNQDSDYYDLLTENGHTPDEAYFLVVDRWYTRQGY